MSIDNESNQEQAELEINPPEDLAVSGDLLFIKAGSFSVDALDNYNNNAAFELLNINHLNNLNIDELSGELDVQANDDEQL